jgi:hypothetical protein
VKNEDRWDDGLWISLYMHPSSMELDYEQLLIVPGRLTAEEGGGSLVLHCHVAEKVRHGLLVVDPPVKKENILKHLYALV